MWMLQLLNYGQTQNKPVQCLKLSSLKHYEYSSTVVTCSSTTSNFVDVISYQHERDRACHLCHGKTIKQSFSVDAAMTLNLICRIPRFVCIAELADVYLSICIPLFVHDHIAFVFVRHTQPI